jgi:hypothetical protein
MARSRRKKPDVEIPEEFEDRSDGWKMAYAHAVNAGNDSRKALMQYADAHQDDDEFNQDDGAASS